MSLLSLEYEHSIEVRASLYSMTITEHAILLTPYAYLYMYTTNRAQTQQQGVLLNALYMTHQLVWILFEIK